MKKLLIAAAFLLFLTGCTTLTGSSTQDGGLLDNYNAFMAQIPDHEFSSYESHRNGVYSSMNIVAAGAKKEDGKLTIESLAIDAKYGPESLTVTIKGYERESSTEEVEEIEE